MLFRVGIYIHRQQINMSPKVLLNRLYYEYFLVLKLVFTYELFNICRVFLFRVLSLDTYNITMSTFYSEKIM